MYNKSNGVVLAYLSKAATKIGKSTYEKKLKKQRNKLLSVRILY